MTSTPAARPRSFWTLGETDDLRLLNVKPQQGDLGLGQDSFLLKPGVPESSVLFAPHRQGRLRPHAQARQPGIDGRASKLVASWIESLEPSAKVKSQIVAKLLYSKGWRFEIGRRNAKARKRSLGKPSGALAISRAELAGLDPAVRKIVREEPRKSPIL